MKGEFKREIRKGNFKGELERGIKNKGVLVLVLSTGTAYSYWYCVLVLRTGTGTAYWYCVLVLRTRTGTAYSYCVLVLVLRTRNGNQPREEEGEKNKWHACRSSFSRKAKFKGEVEKGSCKGQFKRDK